MCFLTSAQEQSDEEIFDLVPILEHQLKIAGKKYFHVQSDNYSTVICAHNFHFPNFPRP